MTELPICADLKLLFLDFDGVLNDHSKLPSGYCGTSLECVKHLNSILERIPDVQVVISSAWRYAILNGDMTIAGFEYLMLTHGAKIRGRLHGHTGADGVGPGHFDPDDPENVEAWKEAGIIYRREQCLAYAERFGCERFVIIDDLDLDHPRQVKTDPTVGLTLQDVTRVYRVLEYAQ